MNAPKVLIACEYSGVVRDAFIKMGFNATSCDLIETERIGPHYKGDVFDIIYQDWDLMVGFPPCTHLAVSGAPHFERKRKDGTQQRAIDFFMKLVNAPIKRIAIENPIGVMSSVYRKPDQIVHPYYFGDDYAKSTCLWLKNLPRLFHASEPDLFTEKTHVEPVYIEYNSKKNKTGKSKYSKLGKLGSGKGKERSLTPSGLANAMVRQWGEFIINQSQ